LIILNILGEEYTRRSSSLCRFLQLPASDYTKPKLCIQKLCMGISKEQLIRKYGTSRWMKCRKIKKFYKQNKNPLEYG
jgi:hypothetical protein